MVEVITPADAFRLLFSAIAPEAGAKFADKITSYDYFWYPNSVGTPDSADVALKALCKYIKDGKIRLQSRSQIPAADIDPIDCSLGKLHVFNQTLTIHAQGAAPDRSYRHVFCVKTDVIKIVRDASKGHLLLKAAPEKEIRDEIAAVYEAAQPNINQLPAIVQPRLENRGYEASGRQIKKIGSEPQFKHLRRSPGQKLS